MLGFSRSLRILTSGEYKQVLDRRQRIFSPYYTLFYTNGSLDNPRLGVIVSKRNVRRATQRNRVKRIARENFRINQYDLYGWDVVLIARREASQATKQELLQCLNGLLCKLTKTRSRVKQAVS